ncbi:MAG: ABC transporter substrate-binding protein [Firmicutes bacterium]|nr:ABC transporter substrate-binding protein [Bacillota bacterium]
MNRKHKKLAFLMITLFMFSIVAGCGSKTAQTPTATTIPVGLNLELSGGAATYGADARDGALLAIEQINAAGGLLGKQLEAIVKDNKSAADEAMSVSSALVGAGVVAQIGPATSGDVAGSTPIVTEKKIPLISPSATNEKVTIDDKTGAVREYIFRVCFIDPFQGTLMAQFAKSTLNAKNAVIIKDSSTDYAKGLADYFKKTFVAQGGTILSEEGFVKDDRDFKAILTKVKGLNPDFIYVPGYYQEVAPLIKQARDLGITATIGGGDGWVSDDLVKVAGAANLNNTFFTTDFTAEDKDAKVVKFVADFQAKYNKVPNSFNALGYDSVQMLAQAIKDAGAADPVKIKDALAKIKDFVGVTGKITIDANHNPIKAGIIIEYVNGKQVMKTRVQP